MENLLVSACLLGLGCRYDGKSKPCPAVLALRGRYNLIPVCPEQLGGLATPRPPAERRGGGVYTQNGLDVTGQYRRGAQMALELAELLSCRRAILKSRSPSCGSGLIHDGLFSGALIAGDGVCAALFKENGIAVFSEEELALLNAE